MAENYNDSSTLLAAIREIETAILAMSDRYSAPAVGEALAITVGRLFAQQDQNHLNAEGLTQNSLMHAMSENAFQTELGKRPYPASDKGLWFN